MIPKTHIESLPTLSDDSLLIAVMRAVKQIAGDVVADRGSAKIVVNLSGYQDSKHLHWHVLHGKSLH